MTEFLLGQSVAVSDCETALATALGLAVELVPSLTEAPDAGVWGIYRELEGDFPLHIQLFRLPETAPADDERFFGALAEVLGSSALIAHDRSQNPYLFRLYRDGLWSSQAVVVSCLDEAGAYVLPKSS